jgi:hypothetical protein
MNRPWKLITLFQVNGCPGCRRFVTWLNRLYVPYVTFFLIPPMFRWHCKIFTTEAQRSQRKRRGEMSHLSVSMKFNGKGGFLEPIGHFEGKKSPSVSPEECDSIFWVSFPRSAGILPATGYNAAKDIFRTEARRTQRRQGERRFYIPSEDGEETPPLPRECSGEVLSPTISTTFIVPEY